jgi:predicted adenylyl cyclase CyaB
MGTNIEIKARLAEVERARAVAERLSGGPPEVLHQEDTFYGAPRGRLKLRRHAGGPAELIYYERADTPGPKRSDYSIYTVQAPDELDRLLRAALGLRGVVRKVRHLYLVGNTRIHLDEVDGLGWFLELEVVLAAGQPTEQGRRRAEELLEQLGVPASDLVEMAYLDLLAHGTDAVGTCGGCRP